MIQSTDESVGRVLAKLEALQLTENTIVFFVSDNGGLTTLENRFTQIPTAVLPLRAGKGWLYEGGLRVPLIVKWPGVIEAGRVIDEPAVTMDLYPTMLAMAALPPRPEQHQDGISLEPWLLDTGRPEHRTLYWHFPHYHGSGNQPSSAVRSDSYKLIEWLEDGTVELYDLENDIGEAADLAATMPHKAEELQKLLDNWRRHVEAKMPVPNPDWSPENP
jgi:arylsulfatase A-like enzyme